MFIIACYILVMLCYVRDILYYVGGTSHSENREKTINVCVYCFDQDTLKPLSWNRQFETFLNVI